LQRKAAKKIKALHRMRFHFWILLFILLIASKNLCCVEICIAPIVQFEAGSDLEAETNISKDLYRLIKISDESGALKIVLLNKKEVGIPKSILDASEICEFQSIKFLIYGYLKKTENYYDAELKIYDHQRHEIREVFYAKDTLTNYKDLLDLLSGKLVDYFYNTLGFAPPEEKKEKETGYMSLDFGVGYWTPFGVWLDSLAGLISTDLSVKLTPVNPLFKLYFCSFFLRYGLNLSYCLGMNRPGYESYFLHTIKLRTPIDICAEWKQHNIAFFSIAPMFQIDLLVQDRLYDEIYKEQSAVMGISIAFGYEYLFENNKFVLGLINRIDAAFYSDLFVSVHPTIYGMYRFKPFIKGEEKK
jgi:hypothetical protein